MSKASACLRSALVTALTIALASCAGGDGDKGSSGSSATKVGHVFVVVLENKDYAKTFASDSLAPYLATELKAKGALLEQYYGIGHVSLGNYIAMISGQGLNLATQTDCQLYTNFIGAPPASAIDGQAIGVGCVFPTTVPNLTDQLTAAGLSWRGYMEDMGNTPDREAAACAHPDLNSVDGTQSATAEDNYATRHNPFMYFHSVIDNQALCEQHVVPLTALDSDLGAVDTTARYSFITPDLCSDGHDSPCADGEPGGLESINDFLQVLVPKILDSAAFKKDGLLIITFDESDGPQSDASACCGAGPTPNSLLPGITGPGGGRVGAVIISPFVKPGTVSTAEYNHYSMLRTVQDLFGLPYLGYAGSTGQASFGADVFTQRLPELPPRP
ncbi:MAG: phosphoesterase [Hydrocarboniphaga sp.]|uniref:alkaline phosphatase family protein n=1 Tax=Hydrocarboniphaga sp. TaxID=2033016 RepID=UPI00261053B4|nr:alkaline phosphatase family protein [Hydrocarboniphaga sp.]MDB5969134.1 phosphoesterase [Hydrocarboniphaga sp.]